MTLFNFDRSPDAFSAQDLRDLADFKVRKYIGSVVVCAYEPFPIDATIRRANQPDVRISKDSPNTAIMLHLNKLGSETPRELVLAATYVALHPELRNQEYVAGVTYRQLAEFAARTAGFEYEPAVILDRHYANWLTKEYEETSFSKKGEPLEPALLYMPTGDFVETYAIGDTLEERLALLAPVVPRSFRDQTGYNSPMRFLPR